MIRRLACLSLVVIAVAGCAGPPPVPVEGTVTLDGKPLAMAILTFFPEGDAGVANSAMSDAGGAFQVRDGMIPGSYRVAVSVDPTTQAGPAPDPSDVEATKAWRAKMARSANFRNPVPARYVSKDTTPLRLGVPIPEGSARIELKTQE